MIGLDGDAVVAWCGRQVPSWVRGGGVVEVNSDDALQLEAWRTVSGLLLYCTLLNTSINA